jgi:hypothetical protein
MPADPTYLGSVQDVRGATVSVALDIDTLAGLAFIEGAGYRIGQVGSFVRIPMGYVDLYGVVSQVGAGAVPERLVEIEPYGRRWMTVQLVGEGPRGGEFSRGLSQYPTIGDPVHLVTDVDLAAIYGHGDSPEYVEIGRLASAESIPALVNINRLVTRHSAVVGATGAGKSTFVAGLVSRVADAARFPSARVLVLDTHGEYAKVFRQRATVSRVNPEPGTSELPLAIPYWAMTFDELLAVTMGTLDDPSRGAVLEKVVDLKRASLLRTGRDGVTAESLTADTPVPFSIHRLWFELHELVNATHTVQQTGQTEATRAYLLDDGGVPVDGGDALAVRPPKYQPQRAGSVFLSGAPLNIRRQLDALAARLRDPRYDFLFRPGQWLPDLDGDTESDLDDLLKRWVGGPESLCILDLSGIPSSILVDLVGTLLRMVYEALFWGRRLPEGGRRRPLLVVLEEAHAYLGGHGGDMATTAVRRIVKEGRKYGIGAMIVSQRPSEIDQTILSQCGTTFALRLSNATDRGHITATVTDSLEGLLAMLPILRTGEAIAIGEAVPLPLRMITSVPAGGRPDSDDPLVYDPDAEVGWNMDAGERDYSSIARAWRALNSGVGAEKA